MRPFNPLLAIAFIVGIYMIVTQVVVGHNRQREATVTEVNLECPAKTKRFLRRHFSYKIQPVYYGLPRIPRP